MTVAHPSSARSSLRWLLIILAIAAIGLLVWWLWPAPQETPQRPGGRPGFGAFGGPVPVRVAKVEQGEFEVFNKALGSVTPLNTVNLRSRSVASWLSCVSKRGSVSRRAICWR